MSALRPNAVERYATSVFPHKADIRSPFDHVRFVPKVDIRRCPGLFRGGACAHNAVTSFCRKPKRKDNRRLFCAAHLVLNTLVDEFGALVEW